MYYLTFLEDFFWFCIDIKWQQVFTLSLDSADDEYCLQEVLTNIVRQKCVCVCVLYESANMIPDTLLSVIKFSPDSSSAAEFLPDLRSPLFKC